MKICLLEVLDDGRTGIHLVACGSHVLRWFDTAVFLSAFSHSFFRVSNSRHNIPLILGDHVHYITAQQQQQQQDLSPVDSQ
jgi:hypothetical protein